MSHRTQITLTDDQYDRLRRIADRTGLGLAELVRRAVDRSYGPTDDEEMFEVLEETFGGWSGREEDGRAYVERLRRGMADRLAHP